MKIEEHNLKEEINETINKALKAGISNEYCSAFRIMREDKYSPKGKALILRNNFYEKSLFDCNACKACEINSPINLNLCNTFIKARQVLTLQNKQIPGNIQILENYKKTGNVYGIIEN